MAFARLASVRTEDNAGLRLRRIWGYTGPVSYTTGGESVTAQQVGLGVIEELPVFVLTDSVTILLGVYNYTTQKLVIFDPAAGSEAANASNTSTFTGRVEVIGK